MELGNISLTAKEKAFNYWLSVQKPEYENSFKVYKPSEDLYHISDNAKITNFHPKIPNFLKPGEDNTISRICTSTVILDALIGMIDTSSVDRIKNKLLTIYRFRPHISVRPTKKALPNNIELNERWIVGYDPTYSDYKAESIGEIFIDKIFSQHGVITLDGYIHTREQCNYHNEKITSGDSKPIQFFICVDAEPDGIEKVRVTTTVSNKNWCEII